MAGRLSSGLPCLTRLQCRAVVVYMCLLVWHGVYVPACVARCVCACLCGIDHAGWDGMRQLHAQWLMNCICCTMCGTALGKARAHYGYITHAMTQRLQAAPSSS